MIGTLISLFYETWLLIALQSTNIEFANNQYGTVFGEKDWRRNYH